MTAFVAFRSRMMSYLMPILFLASVTSTNGLMYTRTRTSNCVPIEEPQCHGKYNFTRFPNILGHVDQQEASTRFLEFKPLIESGCSTQLKFFLCSLHFPMCAPMVPVGIAACRAMCEHVRRKCEPYMQAFSFNWPETIDCSMLPEHTEKIRRCMYPERGPTEEEDDIGDTHSDNTDPPTDDVITDDVTNGGSRDHKKTGNRKRKRERKEKDARKKDGKKDNSHKQEVIIESTENYPEDDLDTIQPPVDGEIKKLDSDGDYQEEEDEDWIENLPSEDEGAPKKRTWMPTSVDGHDPLYQDADADTDYADDEFIDYGDAVNPGFGVGSQNRFIIEEGEEEEEELPQRCKNPDKFVFVEKIKKCLPICDATVDVMFSSSDKRFAYYWMLACSLLCVVSSALTVGTFLVDSKRFRYPERPIIFLSLCYLLYSSAYLVRLGGGPSGSVSCVTNGDNDVSHIVTGDLESTGCTAVFFLMYYFGMAAAVWWVILSVTWFLAAALKWGHEAIEAHGFYFHLVAWVLPAVQTIVVLVMGKVDGDELTGLCYVGNLDPDSLLYFVIVPLTTYLAVGALSLGCGFGSLFKIRRVILNKSGEKDAGKLEKLMLKIGIFTVLYIVPTACVVAVHAYQYKHHTAWVEKAETWSCTPPGFTKYPSKYARYNRQVPETPPNLTPTYGFQDSYYEDEDGPYYHRYYFYGQYVPPLQPIEGQYVPSSAYGHSQYQIKPVDTGYGYKTGTYDHGSVSKGRTPYAPPFYYTGRELVRMPAHLNPGYQEVSGFNRRAKRPLPYSHRLAQASKLYDEGGDSYGADSTEGPTGDDQQTADKKEATKVDRDCHLADSIPSFPIFVIKILMSLLVGITSGIWVWSGKTYKSWKIFCKSSCCSKGDKEKATIVTSNSPHATSSGNINAPPSVTSQLLPKNSNKQATEDEQNHRRHSRTEDRYSYPVTSSNNRHNGYQPVMQDEQYNIQTSNTAFCPSSTEQQHQPASFTLGDIAREYSRNLDEDFCESGEKERFLSNRDALSPPNKAYIVPSQTKDHSTNKGRKRRAHEGGNRRPKYGSSYKGRKKELNCLKSGNKATQKQTSLPSDSGVKYLSSQSNRALPNAYEPAPTNRSRDLPRQNIVPENIQNFNKNFKQPIKQKQERIAEKRDRKYSENDLNKLSLVSQGGFSPVSTSTRKKAESVTIGAITSV